MSYEACIASVCISHATIFFFFCSLLNSKLDPALQCVHTFLGFSVEGVISSYFFFFFLPVSLWDISRPQHLVGGFLKK